MRRSRWMLALLAGILLSTGVRAQPAYGLKGCEDYRGEAFCISVSGPNRAKTVHGEAAYASCAGSAARRRNIEEGTELTFFMKQARVRDLAFQLACLLDLDEVLAPPDVADLTVADQQWKGTLGSLPAGPVATVEGVPLLLVVQPPGDRMAIMPAGPSPSR